MKKRKALLIENPQIDYFQGGAFDIPHANSILPIINQLIPQFETIFVSLDWHPANHVSFAATHAWRQIGQIIEVEEISIELKPIHCVQNTFGAKIHPQLIDQDRLIAIKKGNAPNQDDHSAFFDKGNFPTELLSILKSKEIEELYLAASIGRIESSKLDNFYRYVQQISSE